MNESRQPSRTILLEGRRVGYTVQESRTAQKCRIRVSSAGVVVVLPRGTAEARAAELLRENAAWVLDQLAFQDRMGIIRTKSPDRQPDDLLLRGQKVRVQVVQEPSARQYALVEQQGPAIRIRVPDGKAVDPSKALEAWLRRQARQDILERVSERSREMKVKPGRLYVMGQRTKWGSCSRLRNLSFNWRLVMAPPAVLDYIVVHELAHLIEPSHSTRFWLVVRSYCPQFEAHRRWLRENQEELECRYR